jgi:hypothetical protein
MCVCSDDGVVKKAEDAGWACCEMSSPVLSLGKFTFAERGQRKEAGTRRGKLASTLEVKGAGAGWVIKVPVKNLTLDAVGADAFSSGLMSQPSPDGEKWGGVGICSCCELQVPGYLSITQPPRFKHKAAAQAAPHLPASICLRGWQPCFVLHPETMRTQSAFSSLPCHSARSWSKEKPISRTPFVICQSLLHAWICPLSAFGIPPTT